MQVQSLIKLFTQVLLETIICNIQQDERDRMSVMLRRVLLTVRTHTSAWNCVNTTAMASSTNYTVEHDNANQRFIIYLENGEFVLTAN